MYFFFFLVSKMDAKVGELACQRDSYLREISVVVVSCSAVPGPVEATCNSDSSDDRKLAYYEIVLSDTVLFPTGGGQPHDLGTLNDVPVVAVFRRGPTCIHLTGAPLDQESWPPSAGDSVSVRLDWRRRWDHMTQHSGQHLLSCIAESQEFRFATVSWGLGLSSFEDHDRRVGVSYIEIDIAAMRADGAEAPESKEIMALETRVNESIRKSLPVTVRELRGDGLELEKVDGIRHNDSKIPEDLAGTVKRLVSIGDLDQNLCCGTHVSNTSELQCVKLLHVERVRGKNFRLYFLFADRVLSFLHESLLRDRQLSTLLSTGPDSFVEKVSILSKQLKELNRERKNNLKEIADFTAKSLISKAIELSASDSSSANPSVTVVLSHHRPEADNDFVSSLSKSLNEIALVKSGLRGPAFVVVIVTAGTGMSASVNLFGIAIGGLAAAKVDDSAVGVVWKKFAEGMGDTMKGGGRGGRYQGKVMGGWKRLEGALSTVCATSV
ncbi:hypothetical protein DFJ73DRAFT_96132 [Zopfochytrium polystomum]|nr:hypothetical protein DFJ73DRAFT_96132 [Zopfochytrium polystomum]